MALLAVLARAGRLPDLQVLEDVSQRVQVHQNRSNDHQHERTPLLPLAHRVGELSAVFIHVDAQAEHHHNCHAKREIMTHRTCAGGERATDHQHEEGGPTSGANQRRDTDRDRKNRHDQRVSLTLRHRRFLPYHSRDRKTYRRRRRRSLSVRATTLSCRLCGRRRSGEAPFDPDTVEENSQPTELADVTAEHIFSGITILHGPKNVGKSHVVLSAANSLITHNSLWGMFPVNGVSTKTLLVDSESTPKNFKDRLGKYELQKQKYNFFSICKLASHQDVNLLDEGFQDTLLEKAKEELRNEKTAFDENIEVGAMIETPAAVLISGELARELDFFSIGTNDLTQHTLAMDRQNGRLTNHYNSHHPALIKMIRIVANNVHLEGKRISICGDLAADTTMTELFIQMGIDELSVAPSKVLPLRKRIREIQ